MAPIMAPMAPVAPMAEMAAVAAMGGSPCPMSRVEASFQQLPSQDEFLSTAELASFSPQLKLTSFSADQIVFHALSLQGK